MRETGTNIVVGARRSHEGDRGTTRAVLPSIGYVELAPHPGPVSSEIRERVLTVRFRPETSSSSSSSRSDGEDVREDVHPRTYVVRAHPSYRLFTREERTVNLGFVSVFIPSRLSS